MENKLNNKEYFQKKLNSEMNRIEQFETTLKNIDHSNSKGIRIGKIHLSNLYLNCVKLLCSLNNSPREILPVYLTFLENYKDICTPNDSMYDIIDVFSLGVLIFDNNEKIIDYLEQIFYEYDSTDGMIVFLMNYLKNRDSKITRSRIKYFNELFQSGDKANKLKIELKLWYSKHSDAYWYNSHKSSNNTYCGYWCFEIAALAKILDIDDTTFKVNQYYPYDLVHYKE